MKLSEGESGIALAFEEMLARESSIDRVLAAGRWGWAGSRWSRAWEPGAG